jgi:hypothetical protein
VLKTILMRTGRHRTRLRVSELAHFLMLDDLAAMAQMEPQCQAFAKSGSRPGSCFMSM